MPGTAALYNQKSRIAMELLVLIATMAPVFNGRRAAMPFYSTAHRIREYAVLQGGPVPKNHTEGRNFVKGNMPEMIEAYDALYNLGIVARYDPRTEITGGGVKHAGELRLYILGLLY